MQEWSVALLRQCLASGEVTARKVAEAYLSRIETIDRRKDGINAVIEMNPEALPEADSLDGERRSGQLRGPLHGIPVMLKDNIDTSDRMSTTAGAVALEGAASPQDAFLVRRLRESGAVILGKTNMSEWAGLRGMPATSGWSSRGGLTRNPYDLACTASGSSSGSASAVAANLCVAAIGTETDGSIVSPAHITGIVGLKPTVGLVSRSGIIPISHSQDSAGPMARTVADVAVLLGVMAGVDEEDGVTVGVEGRRCTDYTRFLDPQGLKGARLGVPRNLFGSDARVLELINNCLAMMKSLGAELVEVEMDASDSFADAEYEVMLHEFKSGLNTYLANRGGSISSLQELIDFNEAHSECVMPWFGQQHLLAAQERGDLSSQTYLDALALGHRRSREEGIDRVLAGHRIDALACPTGGPAWQNDLSRGDGVNTADTDSTRYAGVAGYPHITVPAGYVSGLPVGLSFFSGAWQEGKLIQLAYAFEQASAVRVAPVLE